TEVYEVAREEYTLAEGQVSTALTDGCSLLLECGDHVADAELSFTVFNSSGFARSDLATMPAAETGEDGRWLGRSGNERTAQRCNDKWLVQQQGLPSMSAEVLRFVPSQGTKALASEVPFLQEGNTIT